MIHVNSGSTVVRRQMPNEDGGTLPLTLARLTGEFLDLANRLADIDPSNADGVADVEQRLDGSVAAIQVKVASIAALVREFEARAAAAQAEVDRIVGHARAARSHAGWLRDYLLRNLEALDVDRIETATALVVVRDSPPAAEVLDENQIPDAFKRVVQSIDKGLLRSALLDGEAIPGARLVRGRHLVLR